MSIDLYGLRQQAMLMLINLTAAHSDMYRFSYVMANMCSCSVVVIINLSV